MRRDLSGMDDAIIIAHGLGTAHRGTARRTACASIWASRTGRQAPRGRRWTCRSAERTSGTSLARGWLIRPISPWRLVGSASSSRRPVAPEPALTAKPVQARSRGRRAAGHWGRSPPPMVANRPTIQGERGIGFVGSESHSVRAAASACARSLVAPARPGLRRGVRLERSSAPAFGQASCQSPARSPPRPTLPRSRIRSGSCMLGRSVADGCRYYRLNK